MFSWVLVHSLNVRGNIPQARTPEQTYQCTSFVLRKIILQRFYIHDSHHCRRSFGDFLPLGDQKKNSETHTKYFVKRICQSRQILRIFFVSNRHIWTIGSNKYPKYSFLNSFTILSDLYPNLCNFSFAWLQMWLRHNFLFKKLWSSSFGFCQVFKQYIRVVRKIFQTRHWMSVFARYRGQYHKHGAKFLSRSSKGFKTGSWILGWKQFGAKLWASLEFLRFERVATSDDGRKQKPD
jgi:hypothetical protein